MKQQCYKQGQPEIKYDCPDWFIEKVDRDFEIGLGFIVGIILAIAITVFLGKKK